jgi:hypothetical protein
MTSPFPGMDPYLETDLWDDVQHTLAHQISRDLMPSLRPTYVALMARRYVGAEKAPQLSIEIRDVAERRLVTFIEILSPANKVGEGAFEYHQRRLDLLRTYVHLLEIDLLHGGTRITLDGPLPAATRYER